MGHYFTNEKLPSEVRKTNCIVRNCSFVFLTDRGVFSKEGLDFGSRLLLESIPLVEVGAKVLDMGCGYGVFGIVLNKLTNACIDMVDVNLRALHLAKRNLAGKKIVYEILMNAKGYLEPDGNLFLVIRKEQGAKSLISDLSKVYNVEILEKKKGFFVLKCSF